MRVSGLNKENDWQFGRGKANYLSASAAIGQNIVTRLRSFKRDWYLDGDANVDWLKLLGTRGIRVETIRRQIERVVRQTEGVARVDRIVADLNRATRTLTVTVDAVDVFNERQLIEGLQV